MSISVIDNLTIQKNFYLSGQDNTALSILYLPLIGVDSNSLYQVLHSLEGTVPVTKILDLMNFENVVYLDNSLKKLEAVGLLKRYHHQTKGYLLVLKQPLSVESFINQPLLSSYLKDKIGTVEFNELVNKYLAKDCVGYTDLTASFDEVYKSTPKTVANPLIQTFRNKLNDNIFIKNKNFDYVLFKLSFDEGEFDNNVLNSKDFEKEIVRISFQYQLNEQEMKEAILNTMKLDQDLTYQAIANQAMRIFRGKRGTDEVTFVPREVDAFVVGQEESSEDEMALIEKLETMSISDVLMTITGGVVAAMEVKMFDDLAKNFQLPISVVNFMILYVNEEKKGQLPGLSYFEKVASNWKRASIMTVGDAIKFINEPVKEPKDKPKQRRKKEASVPEWYKDYQDTTSSEVDDNTSATEATKAKKRLFGGD